MTDQLLGPGVRQARRDAVSEYAARCDDRTRALRRDEELENRIVLLRTVVGVAVLMSFAALVLAFTALLPFGRSMLVPATIFGATFVGLLVAHDRLHGRMQRRRAAIEYYERGLDRIHGRWTSHATDGERFRASAHGHLYVDDLDLFGPGSLFQRLSTCVTDDGEAALARRLLGPDPLEWDPAAISADVAARQPAVREVAGNLDLRERLVVAAGGLDGRTRTRAIATWLGERSSLPSDESHHWILGGLGLANVVTLAAWFPLGWLGWQGFAVAAVVAWAYTFRWRRGINEVLDGATALREDLRALEGLFGELESESFAAPYLGALVPTGGATEPASRHIRRFRRHGDLNMAMASIMWRPLGLLLLQPAHQAIAIERLRRSRGQDLVDAVERFGEFEALASFGAYAFENPGHGFPDVREGKHGTAELAAFELAHPLLPPDERVSNGLTLRAWVDGDSDGAGAGSGTPAALLVTGSNMSGKSTLLRAVGANAVLALAGSCVAADSLVMSPVQVGASIRVADSLLAGTSHFYAEITRLRSIVEAAESRPVLFLVDEILHGTNSADRRVGTRQVIARLLSLGAIGIATSHDLALTAMADETPGIDNAHFQDHLVEGRMAFDYSLRPGPVTRSNAQELMRLIGLLD